MGQQSDVMEALYEEMEALYQETKHLKMLLDKHTELLTLVADDLASTKDIAALSRKIEIAKELALYLTARLDARIKGQNVWKM
jgi:hypothetical protein